MSAGTAFAAENISAVDDEITVEESVLAIDEDSDALEVTEDVSSEDKVAVASNIVTNDTFFNYFDENGTILSSVTDKDLIFFGDFSGINVSVISIDRDIKFTGMNAIFDGVSFSVGANNVVIDGFYLIQSNNDYLIKATDVENVTISNNDIFYSAVAGEDSYAIFAEVVNNFKLINNTITYVGNTDGTKINNAVYVGGISYKKDYYDVETFPATNIVLDNNVFDIHIPSVDIDYDANLHAKVYSEGLVFYACENLSFTNNLVEVSVSDVNVSNNVSNTSGIAQPDWKNQMSYHGTIKALSVKSDINTLAMPSRHVLINNNEFKVMGHQYTYGLYVSGEDFEVSSNVFNVTSDDYYANAVNVDGPAFKGVVKDNNISVSAQYIPYGIYSYHFYGPVEGIDYINNTITANGYAACGMELAESSPVVADNVINLNANHTWGIVSSIKDEGVFANNVIFSEGNGIGNETSGDPLLPIQSIGISIKGNSLIKNNTIFASDVGINLVEGGNIAVEDNLILVGATGYFDNYALCVNDISSLEVINNTIKFIGVTDGSIIANGVFVTETDNVSFVGNDFEMSLPSAFVEWREIPPSSDNWVGFPVSQGIVIDSSTGANFINNTVELEYNNVSGYYDTIYTLAFRDVDDATVYGNTLKALGHTYIYGIFVTGDNFNIANNEIIMVSDNYYANGIDVEGPATGTIVNNTIEAKGVELAYGIYSGMNGKNASVVYADNIIDVDGYLAMGMSLGDVQSMIYNNTIVAEGNYTMGIASKVGYLVVIDNEIALNSSEQGNISMWESFGTETNGIKIVSGHALVCNNTIETAGCAIRATNASASVVGNVIDVVANEDKDAYAIYASEMLELLIGGNNISYTGKTNGSGINNAIYVNEVTNVEIIENKFNLSLVSSYVHWAEIPAGSNMWVSFPISEGIVIDSSDNVKFEDNVVDVTYGAIVGAYDTIYVVDFVNANNASIKNNDINASGHTYIYGIRISGDDFTIQNNTIAAVSDNYYANGIDIEGPAGGEILGNTISATAVESAYAIYSGMNGGNVSTCYSDNIIVADAYNAFGMSLGDVESIIELNTINLVGNYTTGIAYAGSKLLVNDNTIFAKGSDVGDLSIWEAFGVENIGIKVVAGESIITNNDIVTSGDYAIDVKDTNASVHDNYLIGAKFAGDDSVNNAANSEVYNNTPVINDTDKLATEIVITEVCGNRTVTGVLTANGLPIRSSVTYSVGNITDTVKTDVNGVFHIENVPNNELLTISYLKDSYRLPSNATITLKDVASERLGSSFNVTAGTSISTYAVDYSMGERGANIKFQLTDSEGNPIVNATVQFAYKTTYFNRTTDENGSVSIGISTQIAGEYLCAISYVGDETHNATFVPFSFNIQKKSITISAKAKTYKSSAKTKKYTVTLKTQKGVDGKTYLKSGKKVTLKINGKTYTAKTNSKGQVTFNIKITKKGKFTSVIKFAGDKTYASASKKVVITIK